MLGLSPKGSYFGKFEQNPLHCCLGWVKETEIKMGFWNIRSVTLGLVWTRPVEFCMVQAPRSPIIGGAAGLNTQGEGLIGCFLSQEDNHSIPPELRVTTGQLVGYTGMKGEKTRSELRKLTICLSLVLWTWTNLVLPWN